MIFKILTSSRNTEVSSVSSNLLTAYNKTELSSDTFLQGFFATLDEKSTVLSGAIKRLKEKSELLNLDGIRDDTMRAVWYLVFGLTFHPEEEISNAAKKVFAVLENFGLGIINESYAIESAHISSILAQLSAESIHPIVNLLTGCQVLIERLATAQTNFEHARVEFESIKGNQDTFASASKLSTEMVKLINDQLIVYLNGKLVNDNGTYKGFANTVDQIIADNNMNVRRRLKKPVAEEATA